MIARRLAALLVLVAAWPSVPAGAATLVLGDREREEALRVGQRSVVSETFGEEWRVVNGSGQSVTILTPFHRLALAARHAAFKNEPLKPQDQEKMLHELKDRLRFQVELFGNRQDFARYYKARLLVGDSAIDATFEQCDRSGLRQANGAYLARCVYSFPTKDVTGTTRLSLVVRDSDGQAVARFPIDLGRMR